MIKTCIYLGLLLITTAIYSQTNPDYYGAAGEGFSSSSMGETIDLGYRQFSAPMADELCSQFTGDMVLSSPQ